MTNVYRFPERISNLYHFSYTEMKIAHFDPENGRDEKDERFHCVEIVGSKRTPAHPENDAPARVTAPV